MNRPEVAMQLMKGIWEAYKQNKNKHPRASMRANAMRLRDEILEALGLPKAAAYDELPGLLEFEDRN